MTKHDDSSWCKEGLPSLGTAHVVSLFVLRIINQVFHLHNSTEGARKYRAFISYNSI